MSLLQVSISGAVMILFVLAFRALTVRRLPNGAFVALWWIVVLRLVIPFSVPSTFSVYSFFSCGFAAENAPENTVSMPFIWNFQTENTVSMPFNTDLQTESTVSAPNISTTPTAPMMPTESSTANIPDFSVVSAVDILTLIWLAGMAACAVFFTVAYIKNLRKFAQSLPTEDKYIDNWLAEHRLFRRIRVRSFDGITSPLTYGIFNPVILLPKNYKKVGTDNLKFVLTHEYVHIRRLDALFKVVLIAALCVHWFNPAVWIMFFIANRDIEFSCDQAVLRLLGGDQKKGYAMALIHMEELKSGLVPTVDNIGKLFIEKRLVMIMNYKKPTALAVAAAALLVVGTTVAFATDAKVETNDDTPVQITDSSVSDSTVSSVTSEPVTSEPATGEQNTPVENTTSETVISPVETFRIPVLDSYDESCFGYVETDESGNRVLHFIPFDRLNEPGYVYGCLSHDDEYAVIGKFELSWDDIESFSDVLAKLPIEESVLRVYSCEEVDNMTYEYKLKFGYEHYNVWGCNTGMGLLDENQNLVMRHFPLAIKVYPPREDENNYTHEEFVDGAIIRW